LSKKKSSPSNLKSIAKAEAGVVSGVAVGLIIPQPLGSFVVGPVTRVANGIIDRLDARATRRLERTVETAATRMAELHRLGYEIRDRTFFEDFDGDGSDFEELAETAFRAATNDEENKKAPLFGNLLARTIFTRPIDIDPEILQRSDVIAIVKIAKDLTFRQLCLLGLMGKAQNDNDGKNFRFYEQRLLESPDTTMTMRATYEEFRNLENRDVIQVVHAIGPSVPTTATLTGLSILIYENMELAKISPTELGKVKAQLGAEP
jgi:hypothetical protein